MKPEAERPTLLPKGAVNRAGLVAVILLAPGGFILGFTLVARHYRQRAKARSIADADDST